MDNTTCECCGEEECDVTTCECTECRRNRPCECGRPECTVVGGTCEYQAALYTSDEDSEEENEEAK